MKEPTFKVDIYHNNGALIQSNRLLARIPVAGDYINVPSGLCEVWRVVFLSTPMGEQVRVQLGNPLGQPATMQSNQDTIFRY